MEFGYNEVRDDAFTIECLAPHLKKDQSGTVEEIPAHQHQRGLREAKGSSEPRSKLSIRCAFVSGQPCCNRDRTAMGINLQGEYLSMNLSLSYT